MTIEHFYQKIPGHFTWPDFARDMAELMPLNAHLVEVGVLNGQSVACLGVELLRAGRPRCRIELVDTHIPRDIRDALAPIARLLGPMHEGVSWEVARRFEERSLDYVMLDADHDYESVKKDIAAWLPKVRPGGILCGHDYCAEIPGVQRAVTEAFERVTVYRGERFRGPLGDQPPGNYYPVWCVRVE